MPLQERGRPRPHQPEAVTLEHFSSTMPIADVSKMPTLLSPTYPSDKNTPRNYSDTELGRLVENRIYNVLRQ
jgi:hypothetical protein